MINNSDIVIPYLDYWEGAIVITLNNLNILYYKMYHTLDLNNIEDLNLPQIAKVIEIIWKTTKKLYKEAIQKWIMKTWGRSSDPEYYYNFKLHNLEIFL